MTHGKVLETALAQLEPEADDFARTVTARHPQLEIACLLSLAITAQGIETQLGAIARALEALHNLTRGGR
jgi:hypothetical protein